MAQIETRGETRVKGRKETEWMKTEGRGGRGECACVWGGGGERGRDRETERDRDRETGRQTDRQTDRARRIGCFVP